jgi:hypothetical protein
MVRELTEERLQQVIEQSRRSTCEGEAIDAIVMLADRADAYERAIRKIAGVVMATPRSGSPHSEPESE